MKVGDVILCTAWFGLLSLLIAQGCATGAPEAVTNGVPNLSQVEPGVWRGGQPKSAGAWIYLRSLGLTNDIKLNTIEEGSDQAAIGAGFDVLYFPIETLEQLLDGPSPALVNNALHQIRPGTYVHCQHGQDRTGLLIGLYRLQEGTNAAAAWCEMTNHGYHPALRGLTHYWREQTKSP